MSPSFNHPPLHNPLTSPERPSTSGEIVGRSRTKTGGGAPEAQIWHLLRGLFPEQQVHCQRGKPARHDGQRLGVESMSSL